MKRAMRLAAGLMLATTGVVAMGGMGGCESTESVVTWQPSGMPKHAHPHQDWWSYQYVYFPDAQAYFEPYTRTFYWYENGTWWPGEELPVEMSFDKKLARVVYLQEPLPFPQHESVLVWSPCPKPVRTTGFDPRWDSDTHVRMAGAE